MSTGHELGLRQESCRGAAPPQIRTAYLTNAYPKVSHSFIRREIAALEHQGVEIVRISIRPTNDHLPDPADVAELARTIVLLDGTAGMLRVLRAAALAMITSPIRFFAALRAAFEMGSVGGPGILRHLAYLAEACRLSEILEQRRIRHVHVHFGTNPAAVARLARLLSGISYSITVHGPDEFDSPRQLSLADKIADSVFTAGVSSFGRSQLMRWSKLADWPRISVVRCGVDAGFLDEPPPPLLDTNRLVCVARLSPQKGLPLLVDAAARLVAQGIAFELRLVGDGELREELEQAIQARGLAGHVTITGWKSNADVRAELEQARAMVLPSFAEGLPVVIMEAMALGRPVIATSIAGIPELVDGSCGWLVPAGSVDELAAAMKEVLATSVTELAARGIEGRHRIASRHDAQVNAAEILSRLQPPAEVPA